MLWKVFLKPNFFMILFWVQEPTHVRTELISQQAPPSARRQARLAAWSCNSRKVLDQYCKYKFYDPRHDLEAEARLPGLFVMKLVFRMNRDFLSKPI